MINCLTFPVAAREVIAHDIFLGEFSINYLERGSDNYWMQRWGRYHIPCEPRELTPSISLDC
jgi:hypothetical protein